MNKKPHKHAELIKAWADGAQIEFRTSFHIPGPGGGTCFTAWKSKSHDFWHAHNQYRIKPPEVAQWRKDMAKALDDGKVLECMTSAGYYRCAITAETLLDPEWNDEQTYYRIRPEKKPDVVKYGEAGYVKCLDMYKVLNLFQEKNRHHNLKLTFDGETGELKSAEVIK